MIRHLQHISERACGRRASHRKRFIRCRAKFIPPLLILARRYSWDSRHGPVKRRTCRFSGPRNKLGAVWGPRDSPQPNHEECFALMLTNRETHKTESTLHPCWLSRWIRVYSYSYLPKHANCLCIHCQTMFSCGYLMSYNYSNTCIFLKQLHRKLINKFYS